MNDEFDPADPVTHYCIVRRDIPYGVQAAQLVHAAGESSPGNLSPHTFAVVLTVADAPALVKLANKLTLGGITHKLIVEPTGDYAGQPLALGIVPAKKSYTRKFVSNLPLLR